MFQLFVAAATLLTLTGAASESGEESLARARSLSAEGRHREAGDLYQRAVLEFMEAGDCPSAAEGLSGLRTAAYWSRSPELLDPVESPAFWAFMEDDPGCAATLAVELSLAYKQSRRQDRMRDLLNRAVERGGKAGPYLARARALVLEEVEVELTTIYLDAPVENGSPSWEAAFPVLVERPDQVLSGAEVWNGPGDASADIRVGRVAENLYFRVLVTDDQHITVGEHRDQIVLCLDAFQGSGSIFKRRPLGAENPVLVTVDTAPTESLQALPGVPRAWHSVECVPGGYSVVVCLPKDSVPGIEVQAGNRYGVDVIIRDVDSDGRSTLRWMELGTDPEALYWAGVLAIQ